MKYRVLRDNYGFMGRYWDRDTIVEIPDNQKPPHHFEAVDKKGEVAQPKVEAPAEAKAEAPAEPPETPRPSKKKK